MSVMCVFVLIVYVYFRKLCSVHGDEKKSWHDSEIFAQKSAKNACKRNRDGKS